MSYLRIIQTVVAAIVLSLLSLLVLSSTPTVGIDPGLQSLGLATPVKVHAASSHGIRALTGYLEQNGQRIPLLEVKQPAHRVFFFFRHEKPTDVTFTPDPAHASQLKEGKASLVVQAVSNDFRGSSATVRRDLEVVTKPPRL